MDIKSTIRELSAVHGPSGFEGKTAELCLKLLKPYMDEVYTDRLGSVIGQGKRQEPAA